MREQKDIITNRLILRPSDDERDLENYISHLKSADEFYIQYGQPYSDDELIGMIDFHSSGVIYYSVFLKETGAMVGYVGILPYGGESKSGNLEFYIFKEYRRKHYCQEALNALIECFFNGELTGAYGGMIDAETMSDNEPSCKLLESLGFQKTKVGIRFYLDHNKKSGKLCGMQLCRYELNKGK